MNFSLRRVFLIVFVVVFALTAVAQPVEYNERIADSLKKVLPTAKADTNTVKGMILLAGMSLQRYDSASVMHWSQQAKAMSETIGYTDGVLLALGQMGFMHSITGSWPLAIQEINEAMTLCKGRYESFKLFFYSLRVIISNNREDYHEAKQWAMKTLHHPDFHKGGVMGEWPTYMQLGIIYDNLNMVDSASFYGEKCREIMKVAQFRDLELNSWMILGNVARKRKSYPEAIASFRRFPELALGIGQVYRDMGIMDSAIYYAKIGMENAEKQRAPVNLMASSSLMSALYEHTDPALSLKYLKQYSATRDQLFNAEKLKTLEALQLSEQKAVFDAQKEAAQSRNRLIQMALIGFTLLLLISALSLFRISTVRKRNNEKLSKAYNELQKTQEKLIHAEKMASLGQLTAGIAHEIQNPLNFVNNFAEINADLIQDLKAKETTDQQASLVGELDANNHKIITHGKRAEAIVKSMLHHSNTRAGTAIATNLNTLIRDTLNIFQKKYGLTSSASNLVMETHLDNSLPDVLISPQEIAVVLTNLFTNAVQAMEEKLAENPAYEPLLTITTSKQNNLVMVAIADNGPGIAPALRQKIFQPFFTTKPTGTGTGLGLSLSYDIIKTHGGELSVANNDREGATFSFSLPV